LGEHLFSICGWPKKKKKEKKRRRGEKMHTEVILLGIFLIIICKEEYIKIILESDERKNSLCCGRPCPGE
jgi:hypothetical protein